MTCEKCWNDAYGGGYFGGCETQTHRYHQLLQERKDKPCTKKQQGGELKKAEDMNVKG